MSYGEDDLTSSERARLGIGFGERVYIIRNSGGDVVAIKAIDPVANKESAVDLKAAMPAEGMGTVLELVKMVYGQMKGLPQNYVTVMAPDGAVSRGYRRGIVGYDAAKSMERNGLAADMVVGNAAKVDSLVGKKKSRSSEGGYGIMRPDGYGAGGDSGEPYSAGKTENSAKATARGKGSAEKGKTDKKPSAAAAGGGGAKPLKPGKTAETAGSLESLEALLAPPNYTQ